MLQLEVGLRTDRGLKRKVNEDSVKIFIPEDPVEWERKGAIFLVADGMGGHPAGKEASHYAVNKVLKYYRNDPSPEVAKSLLKAVERVNASLHALSTGAPSKAGMGTTLVAAVLRRDKLWVANVGDSRVYLLRGNHIRQITRDHSLAALNKRNVITRALGLEPSVKVDIFTVTIKPGDILILCTDGLTNPVRDVEISYYASQYPPQEAAHRLVELANNRGGEDNVSVIIVAVRNILPSPLIDSVQLEYPNNGILDRINSAWLNLLFSQPSWDNIKRIRPWRSPLFWILLLILVVSFVGCGFTIGLILLNPHFAVK